MKDEELRTFRQRMDAVFERLQFERKKPTVSGETGFEQTEWGYFNHKGVRAKPPEGVIRAVEPGRSVEALAKKPRTRGKDSGTPRRLWAKLLAAAFLAWALFRLARPSFEYSPPRLELFSDHATAGFDVINHTDHAVNKTLSVTTGFAGYQGPYPVFQKFHERGGTYIIWDRRDITVSLAAFESRHLQADFPIGDRGIPNYAEVAFVK